MIGDYERWVGFLRCVFYIRHAFLRVEVLFSRFEGFLVWSRLQRLVGFSWDGGM